MSRARKIKRLIEVIESHPQFTGSLSYNHLKHALGHKLLRSVRVLEANNVWALRLRRSHCGADVERPYRTEVFPGDISRAIAELIRLGILSPSNDKMGPRGGHRTHGATFGRLLREALEPTPPPEPGRRKGWVRFREGAKIPPLDRQEEYEY